MKLRPLVAFMIAATLAVSGRAAEIPAGASPVDVTRLFLKAIGAQDEATIRQLCLPNHALSRLWTTPLTDEDRKELDQNEKDDLRVLKAGEMIPFAGVKQPIPLAFANSSCVLVYGKTLPNPFALNKFNGEWRINAGPLLAAISKDENQKRLEAIRAANAAH